MIELILRLIAIGVLIYAIGECIKNLKRIKREKNRIEAANKEVDRRLAEAQKRHDELIAARKQYFKPEKR